MALCPRPDKKAHDTRAEAEAALTSLRASGGVSKRHETRWLTVYPCDCGFFHVGDQRHVLERKIRESLRGQHE